MRSQPHTPGRANARLLMLLKSSAILLLFLFSSIIVACSDGTGGSQNTAVTSTGGGPTVTVTIRLGNGNGTPTPPLPGYWCGAWATQTTPLYGSSTVGVYAKFTKNVDGNPEGVDGANAVATVMWPDTTTQTVTALTTADGLAVFSVSLTNRKDAINGITLVTVTFNKDGIPPCKVTTDRAAFFTLVNPSPVATKVPSATPSGTPNATATPDQMASPSPTP